MVQSPIITSEAFVTATIDVKLYFKCLVKVSFVKLILNCRISYPKNI